MKAMRKCVLACLCVWAAVNAGAQDRDPQREVAQIAELLQLSEKTVVADVGAGGGSWTYLLAPRVGRVFATEVKAPQVKGIEGEARRRGLSNVTVIFGTQQEIGLPPNCCEAMLLRLVYHAFRDPPAMRDGIRRAMKAGGFVLIIDFAPSPQQLSEEMKLVGFDQVQVTDRWQGQPEVYAVLFRKAESSVVSLP
jgi:ubiquinone/menaquinone biosynthesis C-methylase UbiE